MQLAEVHRQPLLPSPNQCIMGIGNDPRCRKCTGEETSVHILCECEVLASLRYTYLGSFFLDPDDIKKLGVGAIWRFGNATGLL